MKKLSTVIKSIDIGNNIEIDRKSVCSRLGYKNDVEPSARIALLLDEYLVSARRLIEPSYSYVIMDIGLVLGSRMLVHGSGGLTSNPIMFESEAIARVLKRCDKAALFVSTIGSQLEDIVGRLADDGLIVQAYVLDAIGSNAAEKLADLVESEIEEISSAQGFCISRRFSPGHCDWDISQQRGVFRAMGVDSAGVNLTENYLMVPQKSISGIIGIGSCNSVNTYNPCETCNKRNCPGRR
jgi:hypothetical protein